MSKLQVIGSPVSPFVRKALAVTALRGVAFEAAWIVRSEPHPAMMQGMRWSDALMTVMPHKQRAKLMELGAPVMAKTLVVDAPPRRGPMTAA